MSEYSTQALFDLVNNSRLCDILLDCTNSALKQGVSVDAAYTPWGEWALVLKGGTRKDQLRMEELVSEVENPVIAFELLKAACREKGQGKAGQNRAMNYSPAVLTMKEELETAWDADTPVNVPSLFDGLPEGWEAE